MKRTTARKNSSSTASNTRIVLDANKVFFTTQQLVEILKDNDDCCVEASLQLNCGVQSCHVLNYHSDDGVLYDSGCDDEERTTTLEEFANDPLYGDIKARWRVWLNKN